MPATPIIQEKVYRGDIGTAIGISLFDPVKQANVVIDTYNAIVLNVLKPDGITQVQWSANLSLNKSEIFHVTVSGDLDQAGDYKIQAYLDLATWQGHTSTTILHVNDLFE